MNLLLIKRALISVSDKTGILEFAKKLDELRIEIVSTGGTAKVLSDAGVNVIPVQEITGFPEMMDGRVKTLHPAVHGAILAKRSNPMHMEELRKQNIQPIDLVVVNLYPFAQVVAKRRTRLPEAIENIDIGGPTMIRAAAKNFEGVSIVVNPKRYKDVLSELTSFSGCLSLATRKKLAVEAFKHTSEYDRMIHTYLRVKLA